MANIRQQPIETCLFTFWAFHSSAGTTFWRIPSYTPRTRFQSSIRESDLCSLTLSAAPAPHTESLSAQQTPTLSFTVLSVESEWSAPSLK